MVYSNTRNKELTFLYFFILTTGGSPYRRSLPFNPKNFFDIFCKKYLLFFEPHAIITKSLVKQ